MTFLTTITKPNGRPLVFRLPLFKRKIKKPETNYERGQATFAYNIKMRTPFYPYDIMLVMKLPSRQTAAVFFISDTKRRNKKYLPFCIDEMMECDVILTLNEMKTILSTL